MLTDKQLDQAIRGAIRDMANSDEVPDFDLKEAWGRLQKKLRVRRIKGLVFRSLVIAALLLCFGTFAAVTYNSIRTIGDRRSHLSLMSACSPSAFIPSLCTSTCRLATLYRK